MRKYLKNPCLPRYLQLLLLLCCVTSCVSPLKKPQVVNGQIDLGKYDFRKTGIVNLTGTWAFYWKKLHANPGKAALPPDGYMEVPKPWNLYQVENQAIGKTGYATYQLKVNLPQKYLPLALKIPVISTSCKVFINGRFIREEGKVGRSEQENVPFYQPSVITFSNHTTQVNITIQVANYHHREGGIRHAIALGLESQIRDVKNRADFTRFFLLGSILIMAFYHLGLFWVRGKNISALNFGLFCLIAALRIGVEGEVLILYLFSLDWFTIVRLEYLSIPFSLLTFAWFLYSLFPMDFSKKAYLVLSILFILVALAVLVLSPYVFTHMLIFIQLLLLVACVYGAFILIKASVNRREGAVLLLIGFALLFASVIHDVLYSRGVIQSSNQFATGLFIFILTQAQVLSLRFSNAFIQTKQLTQKLDYTNKNLEEMVVRRTASLNKTNDELNRESKKTRESLKAAQLIQNAILPAEKKLKELFNDRYFTVYRPKDIVSGDFYWVYEIEESPVVYLAVVDCTGHGVPGALMSMIGYSFLNEIINQAKVYDTREILRQLHYKIRNELIKEKNDSGGYGMDVCLCKLEKTPEGLSQITFTGAKRPLYYTKAGELNELKGDRISIGVWDKDKPMRFNASTILLEEGEMIYLTTDGFSDTPNPKRQSFGTRRMKKMLTTFACLPTSDQNDKFLKVLDEYQQSADQRDDITIMGIRV